MSYGAPSEITLAREAASYKCRSRNLRHIYFQNEPRFRSRPRSRAVICECKKTNGAIAQRTLCTLPSGRAARRIGVNVQNKAKKNFSVRRNICEFGDATAKNESFRAKPHPPHGIPNIANFSRRQLPTGQETPPKSVEIDVCCVSGSPADRRG